MTPEEAEDVFYAAYTASMLRQHNWTQPVVQQRARMDGWHAVITEVSKQSRNRRKPRAS